MAHPAGGHTQRFWLLEAGGGWRLAVVGEERETRDGHYVYTAVRWMEGGGGGGMAAEGRESRCTCSHRG